MKALCTTIRDPFRPMHARECREVRSRQRIRALAPKTSQPFIALLNGKPILRAAWNRRLQNGDSLAFLLLPQGGGGGGSNPLVVVAMIALSIYAPGLAMMMAGGNGATAFAVAAWQAGIMMAGSMLINALLPPPKASAAAASAAIAAASPTYSLQAQGNQARLDAPIPVLYGRHQVFPDFAATPYAEYSGNEQYLYELLLVTQGQCQIQQILIADATLDAAPVNDGAEHVASGSFTDISYQIIPPGGTVTLFPSRVVTSPDVSGAEALTSAILGPFPSHPAGAGTCNAIAIDVVFPRGLYYANTDGSLANKTITWIIEAAPINTVGTVTGSFVTIGSESFSAATTTPQRQTYRYTVTVGRYTVRFTRTDAKDTSTQAAHEIDWAGMRAYIPGAQAYGNVTLLALRMKATNQLSSAATRKINVIAQRLLPVWNGSTWSAPTATRSIAWAFADAARNTDYGSKLPDARIDLTGLLALDATWATRGDHYDGVFDALGTCWEAMTQIARAGRAMPVYQGGILYALRDQAQTLPVAMFTPRNIARGSLKLDYTLVTEDTCDGVEITYFDGDVWSWQTVTCQLPGGTYLQPAKLKLPGVTSRDQAWREGITMAASNRYRRRFGSHQTEMEGLIPRIGDLIAISHDMPAWGVSGDIIAHTGIVAGSVLTLSEPVVGGGTRWLAISAMDGSVSGPWQVSATDGSTAVTLLDSIPSFSWPDPYLRERPRYALGTTSSNLYIQARVLTIKPASPEKIDLTWVVESAAVHTADTGATPGASGWQLPAIPDQPIVTGLIARPIPGDLSRAVLSWLAAPGATSYLIEVSGDGVRWTRCGDTSATSYSLSAIYGYATRIRVAAIGAALGPWITAFWGDFAFYMWAGSGIYARPKFYGV